MSLQIPILRVGPHAEGIPVPTYMTEHAAGMDIYAACEQDCVLEPGERALIPSGFALAIPEGFEVQIRPRSGLALKQGVTCLNTPGTIDADYRGEVKILLINRGRETVRIRRMDRIAQMVVKKVEKAQWVLTDKLPESGRSEGGFGSTGHQ